MTFFVLKARDPDAFEKFDRPTVSDAFGWISKQLNNLSEWGCIIRFCGTFLLNVSFFIGPEKNQMKYLDEVLKKNFSLERLN